MAGEDHPAVGELMALLREEAAVIRRGALSDLAALAARKAELVEALPALSGPAFRGDLARIGAAAEANGSLLAAALRGIEAARVRLTIIREAALRLDSYDSMGRARTVSFAGGTVERRA